MSYEHETQPQYVIEPLTIKTSDEATRMRLQSWLDTYVNDDVGVTREWIEARNRTQLSPEKQAEREARMLDNPSSAGWVARDGSGDVIGVASPYRDEAGGQHLGSLYVDMQWHGTGVASALMQKIIDWADTSRPIELGVVAYNERAKAFYRKWGFEEVPDSETLFDDKIPEIKMVRKGDME